MTFLSLAKFRPTKLSYIAAPLLYGALAVLLTWPMARHLGTHLLGQSDDTPLHYWNCWWVQHALLEGHSPYFTRYLFYPRGVSLLTHNIAWGNALGFILLEPLLGGIAAYNLTLILSLALCGWAAFALLRHLTHHLSAALLGGIIYQAWPYRLSQLGHPNLLSTFWIPIFILALLRTLEHRQRRDALFVGLAFALVGYTRWQLLIPATIMGSFLFAAWFWANRPSKAEGFRQPFKQAWQRLALGAAVALLLLLPPLVLLARELRGDLGLQELFRQDEARSQADLMAYLTPQASHPLFGSWSRALYERYYADRQGGHYPAYLGLATFVLALIGLIRRPRQGWPWAALILFFGLLALGPLLRINGVAYPRVPTLYGLLAPLEVLRILREPGRYVLFLALPFAALAALAIASLSIPRPALCWVALAALIVAEYLPIPIPLRYIKAPPQPYVNVAASPSTGAVLDLPIDPYKAKVYMFDQTVHGRPLIQGHLSRLPASAYAYIDANPWLATLRQQQEMPPWLPDVSRQLDRLADDHIEFLVLHKNLVGQDRIAHWRRYLLMSPRYEDDDIVLFGTKPVAGVDFPLRLPLAPNLYVLESVLSGQTLARGQVLEVDIGWGTSGAPGIDYDLILSLVDERGVPRQVERLPISPSWPPSQWTENTLLWDYYRFYLTDNLPVGHYTLVLQVADRQGHTGEKKRLAQLTIQAEPVLLADDPQARDVDAVFGEQLRLVEYKLEHRQESLGVSLYWRAEQRMDTDYKVFVHIYDPANGAPVAQDDAMPRRWAYPTRFWWPGELVVDRFDISLREAPPGHYGVAVGVYDPADGRRLDVVRPNGSVSADGRLLLDETVVIAE